MERFETTYRGYRLIARQQFNGWQVQIMSGKPVLTNTFSQPDDAFASARKIIDRGVLD